MKIQLKKIVYHFTIDGKSFKMKHLQGKKIFYEQMSSGEWIERPLTNEAKKIARTLIHDACFDYPSFL